MWSARCAQIRLFDDKSFKDRVLVVKSKEDQPDLDKAVTEDGKKGFEDKASSARFQIPKGWKLVLFDDKNYKDSGLELKGTGKVVENSDFGSFSDKASSYRWEQDPQ